VNELVRLAEPEDAPDATETDLIATIKAAVKEAREARRDWLTEAQRCYDFVAGHQWTDEELQALKDQLRPSVVFNLVEPVINVVAGLEVTNRQEVKYLPRTLDDAGPNEVLTGAAEWTRDECDAEDEESEAFLDMATCGEGWTDTRLDYEYDPDGGILTDRVDAMEMLPDPNSKKKNYKDAEFLVREKMVLVSWLEDTWPEKADEIDVAATTTEDSQAEGETHLNVVGDQYRSPGTKAYGTTGGKRREMKLTEYQYKKRVPYYRIQDPTTGEMAEFTVEQHDQLQQRAQALLGTRLKSIRQTKCVYHRAFAVGDVLLENRECPDPGSFTYKAMTAKRDKKKKCWYGLVRGMIDPQQWTNKFVSQSMHILNSNAKGGVVYEEGAVGDAKEFEQSWAHPSKPTKVAAGALTGGRIQPKQPPAFPPQLDKLLEFSVGNIYRTSGVSPEMLGAVDREQAAVLEYQRKQAGVTILATLFDALRKYRKEQGRTLLYLIQTYLSDGRLVRIVGEAGMKYVPLTKQDGTAKYDVIIDESPSSPNQKEKTWSIIQGLLPLWIKTGQSIPQEFYDYLPLPQSLIDKMKQPDPQKQQEAQQAKEMAIREKQAEIGKTEAEAKKAEAEALAKITDAGLKKAEIQGQDQQAQNKLVSDTIRVQREADLKAWQAQQDAALEAWKAEQKAALDARIANFNASLQRNQVAGEMELKRETAKTEGEIAKEKLAGEQEAKGIKDIRANKELQGELQKKVDFLNEQLKGLREDINTPDEILRDAKGKVTGKRKVRKTA